MGVEEAGGGTHMVQIVEIDVYVTVDTLELTTGTAEPEVVAV